MGFCKRLLLAFLVAPGTPALACYAVYDSGGRIVYQSDKPPVDMARALHETLPERFPAGSHLVFDNAVACPSVISPLAVGDGGPLTRTQSTLLTDGRTARAQRLPHRTVGHDIAVVPPDTAAMEPGLSVLPSVPARPGRSR
jgi:hypothetical protein